MKIKEPTPPYSILIILLLLLAASLIFISYNSPKPICMIGIQPHVNLGYYIVWESKTKVNLYKIYNQKLKFVRELDINNYPIQTINN